MTILTEQEIEDLCHTELDRRELSFARAIESAVIAKIKTQGPAVSVLKTEDGVKFIHKKALPVSDHWQQTYKLPEGVRNA